MANSADDRDLHSCVITRKSLDKSIFFQKMSKTDIMEKIGSMWHRPCRQGFQDGVTVRVGAIHSLAALHVYGAEGLAKAGVSAADTGGWTYLAEGVEALAGGAEGRAQKTTPRAIEVIPGVI